MSLSELSGSGDTGRLHLQLLAKLHRGSITFLCFYILQSTVTAISFKPKATRNRLKKEILSDDFKKRKIF
jgi:hypothetical protein